MVRMLNHELGVPLKLAAVAADRVLTEAIAPNRIRISASTDGSMALQLDLPRFLSTSNASLAAAFAFAPARGRGRPRHRAKKRSAVDDYSPVWEIKVDNDPVRLERLTRQLLEWEAYPRGIQPGLSFIMDVATLRAVPRLALTTTRGEIDVILEPVGALAGASAGK